MPRNAIFGAGEGDPSRLERAGGRGKEPGSGPRSRPGGRGGAVGLSEAAFNSSRRAGGRVQAAAGASAAGGSAPVGSLAAERWSNRILSRRSTMVPPPVRRAGPCASWLDKRSHVVSGRFRGDGHEAAPGPLASSHGTSHHGMIRM